MNSSPMVGVAGALLCFGVSSCGDLETGKPATTRLQDPLCEGLPSELFTNVEAYRTYRSSFGFTQAFVEARSPAVIRGFDVNDGVALCSGSLISRERKLVLTAGHCLLDVGDEVRFNYQAEFGSDLEDPPIGIRPVSTHRIVEVVDAVGSPGGCPTAPALDHAVVRLEDVPAATWPEAPLRIENPLLGEWLAVIGHPNEFKTTLANGSAAWGLKTITHGPRIVSNWCNTFLPFRANIEPGNSGSGLLNASGEIVGVVVADGCVPWVDPSGNDDPLAPFTGANAVPVSNLYARWQSRGLTELTNLVRPARTSPCLSAALPNAQRVSAGSVIGNFYVRSSSQIGYGAYGHDGCPFYWVVEVTNTLGKGLYVHAKMPSIPASKGVCKRSILTSFAQGYRDGAWHAIYARRSVGEWDNDGECLNSLHGSTLSSSHGFSKLRIAVRHEYGEHHPQEGPMLQSVTAGVRLTSAP